MTTWTAQEAEDGPLARRGPMRPRPLVSVRANQAKRLSSHVFRTVDLIALAAIVVIVIDHRSSGQLLATPARQALPLVAGALVLGRSLRSLGLYRFVRSEGLLAHLGH